MNRIALIALTTAAAFSSAAPAQRTFDRAQLLGPDLYKCGASRPCDTVVDVGSGGTDDPSGCHVAWAYRGYDVEQRSSPKLTWRINKDTPGDASQYFFAWPERGVRLDDRDENDERYDLTNGTREGFAGQAYSWIDKNLRRRDMPEGYPNPSERGIRFNLVVYRTNPTVRCDARDPVVLNRGN